jgi:hypothetical protein
MPVIFHVRYIGSPKTRRMIIQRSDNYTFWDGSGWVEEVGRARLYRNLRDAQAEALRHQQGQIDKLPRREFRCTLSVTVYGDGGRATARDVGDYLKKLMVIGIDFEGVEFDSPLAEADAFVQCRAKLDGLKEVKPRQPRARKRSE